MKTIGLMILNILLCVAVGLLLEYLMT